MDIPLGHLYNKSDKPKDPKVNTSYMLNKKYTRWMKVRGSKRETTTSVLMVMIVVIILK